MEARIDSALWAVCKRTRRVNALAPDVTQLVADYWTGNTCISPNRKDVIRKRIGAKEWIDHPTHHLQESQVSFNKHNLDWSPISSVFPCFIQLVIFGTLVIIFQNVYHRRFVIM